MSDKLCKALRVQYETLEGEAKSILLVMAEENLQDLQKKVDLALRVIAKEKARLSANSEKCCEHIILDRDEDGNVALRPEGKE